MMKNMLFKPNLFKEYHVQNKYENIKRLASFRLTSNTLFDYVTNSIVSHFASKHTIYQNNIYVYRNTAYH